MEVRDSRRLTGPNLLMRSPGAVLDVAVAGRDEAEAAAGAWRGQARRMLEAVGWGGEKLHHRRFAGGLSLAFSAPVDALYAATEVNEWAWEAAAAVLAGRPAPDLDTAARRLRAAIEAESNPALLALEEAAADRGVAFLSDDEEASVGLGAGSITWEVAKLPLPEDVAWDAVSDVPVALVTGTNGKTTTVRLLAALLAAAGKRPGITSTDGVWAGTEKLDSGDFSGPGGARRVLRDRRVEAAVLEVARGGMLRRGVGVRRAEVAVLTNVAEDHLGEWGIGDLGELADTKLVVAQAARELVVNAEDPSLRPRAEKLPQRKTWFGLQCDDPALRAHVEAGGAAALLEGEDLVLYRAGERHAVARLGEVPLTLGGAARHNTANALAALGAAGALGLPLAAMRQGLVGFESSSAVNPGRLNRFRFRGVDVLVDFAHNPHGVAALLETAAALPARRRLVLLGQGGDRDDESIRELARAVWRRRPDRVVVKELPKYLRGRQPGEVPGILVDELRAQGAPEEAIGRAGSELEAVEQALAWAEPGDLLLLISHESQREVLERLEWEEREERESGKA